MDRLINRSHYGTVQWTVRWTDHRVNGFVLSDVLSGVRFQKVVKFEFLKPNDEHVDRHTDGHGTLLRTVHRSVGPMVLSCERPLKQLRHVTAHLADTTTCICWLSTRQKATCLLGGPLTAGATLDLSRTLAFNRS